MSCVGLQNHCTSDDGVYSSWSGRGFCEPSQYKVAIVRCQNGYESCDLFIKAFEQRAAIERDYITTINNWSKSWQKEINKSGEFGMNKKCWLKTIRLSEETIKKHENILEHIQHNVIDPMIDFKGKNYQKSVIHVKKIKEFEKQFEAAQDSWLKLLSKIHEARESFHEKHRKYRKADQACKILVSNVGASDEEKQSARLSVSAYGTESEISRSRYQQLIEEMKNKRPQYENGMKEVLDRTHEFERERLNMFKKLFTAFYDCMNVVNDSQLNEASEGFQKVMHSYNTEADIEWWNSHFGSDTNTRWPEFEDIEH